MQDLTRLCHAENLGQNDQVASGSCITVHWATKDEI